MPQTRASQLNTAKPVAKGKSPRKDVLNFILGLAKGRHQYEAIGDVEIRVARGKGEPSPITGPGIGTARFETVVPAGPGQFRRRRLSAQ